MATTLAPVDSREVVRCDRCHLVQFRTVNNNCRRCRTCLDPEEPEPVMVAPAPQPVAPTNGNGHSHLQVALAIRTLRHRSGLSQRQLALRMNVPRTYVSKIENDKATPTLSSLERLARALEVGIPDLLDLSCRPGERSREDDIRDLMGDDFVSQLVPFVSKLNGMQWSTLLAQVRDLTLNPRRSS